MQASKEQIIRRIQVVARERSGGLASRLIRASSAEKEEILAALDLERWLADACVDAIGHDRYGASHQV